MKRLSLLTVLLLIGTILVAAAPPEEASRGAFEVVARYLQLTPEQVEAWMGLLIELKESNAAIHEQVTALEEELRGIMESEEPDPMLVGALVLQIHSLRSAAAENTRNYRTSFAELLDEEQLKRLEEIRRAEMLQKLLPAFKQSRLL